MKGYKAVAFDIDGTLYPSWKFNLKIVPYFLCHLRFFIHYSRVRKKLHKTAPLPDLFEYQARLLAQTIGKSSVEAKEQINRIVYTGLSPYFDELKPFPYLEETFQKIHDAGIKIALLSDFPPEQKGSMWNVLKYCDVVMGSEEIGALKPSIYPFGVMAMALDVDPSDILYVGNSIHYDIEGAKNAGMHTAYIEPLWRRLFHRHSQKPDFSFKNYRILQNIVLK